MDAFITFFKDHLPRLSQYYQWPKRIPKPVADAPWVFKTNGSDECIDMKHHLTELWKKGDEAEKKKLASWIVSGWGGVRANSLETLAGYLTAINGGSYPTSLQGVASYSKILSVVDCQQYSIYDARVAAALNAVQLMYPGKLSHYYPYVPSRNGVIRQFMQAYRKTELVDQRGWQEVSWNGGYNAYCQLLIDLKTQFPGREIYHFEMTLFSMAPELCRQTMKAERAKG